MATYSTNVTRSRTGQTLEVTEDILYGGVRVGGVQVVIEATAGSRIGQLGQVVTGLTQTSSLLQQDVDVTYNPGGGAVVIGHISVTAQPDPEIGHSVSVQTNWLPGNPYLITANTT